MSKTLLVVALVAIFATIANAQDDTDCSLYDKNPDACLGTEECSYCITATFKANRCNVVRTLARAGCPRSGIINFIESAVTVLPKDESEKPNPLIPFPLVPGTKRNLTITFELANHPVDVYYLMDFSGSMWDDKANVVALSSKLEAAVDKMASDSTLGFGSFVDKPLRPLGWDGGDYSYKNVMPLRANKAGFADMVNASKIFSGFDRPEAQVDAMFQSVACTSQVGWRKHARHLLILATDDSYHVAGDGLAAGISTPFDGECHLNSTGFYSEEIKLDYPSVDQLVAALETHQVTPIFAVTEDAEPAYNVLSSKLKASGVATLTRDSSNIVDLLTAAYEKIDSRIEVETTPVTDEIVVKFYSSCNAGVGGATPAETTICDALNKDRKVTFTMEVELRTCPADPKDWSQLMTVNPVGLPTGVDLGLALIC